MPPQNTPMITPVKSDKDKAPGVSAVNKEESGVPVQQQLAPLVPTEKKGSDLLAYLVSIGTGSDRVEWIKNFLNADPDASAEKVLGMLQEESGPIQQGAIRMAGKWIYGGTWEPNSAAVVNQSEELKNARSEMAVLKRTLSEVQTVNRGLRAENNALRKHNALTTADRVASAERIKELV